MGLIYTKHALGRLKQRQVSQEKANLVYSTPDTIKAGKKANTQEYSRRFGQKTITLVVGKGQQGENLIISAWIDPPEYGTKDYYQKKRYQKYQQASGFKKIWLIIKEQFGF